MKYLQEKVIFNIAQSSHLKNKEMIELKLEPISDTVYKNIATTRLSDRKTNKMTRILLNSLNLQNVSQVSELINKKVTGTIVEFSKKDGSKFIGVDTYSIDLLNKFANKKHVPLTSPPKKAVPMKRKSMLDVATEVLVEKNIPYHYKPLTNYMIDNGLFISKGKTPEATLIANIGKEIKLKGNKSRFIKINTGIFGLNPKLYPQFEAPQTKGTSLPVSPAQIVTNEVKSLPSRTQHKKSFISKLISLFIK